MEQYLKVWWVSQLEVVEHCCIVSVQFHQVVVVTLLHNSPFLHQDDVITVRQVLHTNTKVITMATTCSKTFLYLS